MRILCSRSNETAWNLAAEEVLFKGLDSVLLLYINRASVVIGCNQVWQNEIDQTYCQDRGIGVYRRMSGGGAVFHDPGNINYCFIRDKKPQESALDGAFLEPVEDILHSFGLKLSRANRKDLWAGAYKISGTASHISKNRTLHHGTLLFDSDLNALHAALGLLPAGKINESVSRRQAEAKSKGIASVPSPVANIKHICPNLAHLSAPEFLAEFLEAALQYYGREQTEFTQQELKDIQALVEEKYQNRAWNELK